MWEKIIRNAYFLQVLSDLHTMICGKRASTNTKLDERESEGGRRVQPNSEQRGPMAVSRLVYARKQLPKSLRQHSLVQHKVEMLSFLPFAPTGVSTIS